MKGSVFACDSERLLELPRVRDGNRWSEAGKIKAEIACRWKRRR